MIRNFIRTCRTRVFVDFRLVLLAAMAGAGCDLPQGGIAREMRGADTVSKEGVTVHYSKGLSRQAECFATVVAKQMANVQGATSYELQDWLAPVHVYLKFVQPEDPASGSKVGPYVWELPILVDPNETSCAEIMAKNDDYYPFDWMHELIEFSLCTGDRPRVPSDQRCGKPGEGNRDELCHTRWFNEGFASYCGVLASRSASYSDGAGGDEIQPDMCERRAVSLPFSSLARVRGRLFLWLHDDSHADYPFKKDCRDVAESRLSDHASAELDHYDAALALFLLIEDRYGPEAIRKIGRQVSKLKNGGEEDLRRIVSGAVGTDIVKLVDGFRFPDTGLIMLPVYRPPATSPLAEVKEGLWVGRVRDGSPAQRAGLKRDDVIGSLDGERILRNFDFECALYKHMRQDTVKIGLWRKGAGRMTVEMKLGK
ncbi:MAG: PDZ domain-containing protein [Planctomycetota bacterium]|nr:PDZ domain-containing protein [Planctomycetota bacterium]